jgi:hypothetical protein
MPVRMAVCSHFLHNFAGSTWTSRISWPVSGSDVYEWQSWKLLVDWPLVLLVIYKYLVIFRRRLVPCEVLPSRAEKPHKHKDHFHIHCFYNICSMYLGQRICLYLCFYYVFVHHIFVFFLHRSFTPYFKPQPVRPTITMVWWSASAFKCS